MRWVDVMRLVCGAMCYVCVPRQSRVTVHWGVRPWARIWNCECGLWWIALSAVWVAIGPRARRAAAGGGDKKHETTRPGAAAWPLHTFFFLPWQILPRQIFARADKFSTNFRRLAAGGITSRRREALGPYRHSSTPIKYAGGLSMRSAPRAPRQAPTGPLPTQSPPSPAAYTCTEATLASGSLGDRI